MAKIIEPSAEILTPVEHLGENTLRLIERAGRTCYQSFDKISEDSHFKFVQMILKRNHLTVIEHISITAKIICDRGVTHEAVRHRLASFSQESTHYCDYNGERFGGDLVFIRPFEFKEGTDEYNDWYECICHTEQTYKKLRAKGYEPKWCRSVLPNSLKAEIVITANLREWRHIFDLRTATPAHPQIRQVMIPLLYKFKQNIPVIFDDLFEKYVTPYMNASEEHPYLPNSVLSSKE